MKNIIIHYPYVPNYRVPVFNCIAQNKDINLLVMSASDSTDKTILSKKNGWFFSHIETNLKSFHFFGLNFDFETGVLVNLFKLRKSYGFYVILSNPNILSSWFYSVAAKILGYEVIFWGHGLLKEDKGIKALIRSVYYKIPDKFWLYGNNAIKLMQNTGVSKHKLFSIYNSLDYFSQKKYRELHSSNRLNIRSELGVASSDLVLICMGRLLPKLEIEKLLEYLSSSFRENLTVSLKVFIIGSGPSEKKLKQIVYESALNDNVKFLDAIYDEAVLSKYYMAADASIVMGIVGLAAMHSLAYGVPVITHSTITEHCPEVEAIIEGRTGYFFEKNNIDSFYDAIKNLKKSRDREKDIYNDCVSTIERFYTPEKQVEFILESLKK